VHWRVNWAFQVVSLGSRTGKVLPSKLYMTSDHRVAGSSPAGSKYQIIKDLMDKRMRMYQGLKMQLAARIAEYAEGRGCYQKEKVLL